MYDIATEDWILQQGELQQARENPSAMMVDASQFPSCNT
jgi:hypothetical protein